MDGVKIFKLENEKNDEKGVSYKIKNIFSESINLYYRNSNVISGKHYHNGNNPFKNPEKLILIKGKCELYCKNLDTQEEEKFQIEAPIIWHISPRIYHEVRIIEDCIYIEPGSNIDDEDAIEI